MTDADELAKLAAIHAAGSLTDDEFTTAKARLLRDATRGDTPAPRQSHRGRWAVIAGVVALIGVGTTAAIVASSSDRRSKSEVTQPTTQPTTVRPPVHRATSATSGAGSIEQPQATVLPFVRPEIV